MAESSRTRRSWPSGRRSCPWAGVSEAAEGRAAAAAEVAGTIEAAGLDNQ